MFFGIDIQTSSVKFVQVARKKAQWQIVRLLSFHLPAQDRFSSSVARELKSFLLENKIKISHAVVSISGKELNIRYLKAISTSPNRIAPMVEMELAQFAEKVAEPLVHTHKLLQFPKMQEISNLVVVAVAYNSWLERIYTFFQTAGISIYGFVPNTLAIAQAYSNFGMIRNQELMYLVNLDRDMYDVAIANEDTIFFLRNMTQGTSATSNVEEVDIENEKMDEATMLTADARNATPELVSKTLFAQPVEPAYKVAHVLEASLKFAKLQLGLSDLKPKYIIVSGSCPTMEFCKDLSSQLHIPVEGFMVSENIVLDASISPDIWPSKAYSFVGALGAAIIDKKEALLLHSKQQQDFQEFWHKKIWHYASISIMMIASIILLGYNLLWKDYYSEMLQNSQDRYQTVLDRSQKIESVEKDNQIALEKIMSAQMCLAVNAQVLDTLSWLQKNVPESMYLTQVEFKTNENGLLVLLLRGIVEESNNDVYTSLREFKKNIETTYRISQEKDPKLHGEGRLEFEIQVMDK